MKWLVLMLIVIFAVACDPVYRPLVGPLRLPLAIPPTHVIKIAGASSNFPLLEQITFTRLARGPSAKLMVFTSTEILGLDELQEIFPKLLNSLQLTDHNIDSQDQVEGVVRFVGYGQWRDGESETTLKIRSLPIFEAGRILYVVAAPLPDWVEVKLRFHRIHEPALPSITVQQIMAGNQAPASLRH